MPKKLRCYLRMHRWVKKYVPGQQPYFECRDCGEESDRPGEMIAPTGG